MNIPPKKCLTVIHKRGSCSVQDLGRMSSQHLGFSASGAADEYAFLYANYILLLAQSSANTKAQSSSTHTQQLNNAQLEITLGQISFQAQQNCTIAISGADCAASINKKPISNWQVHHLKANDVICFEQPKTGLHTYLAIMGGIQNKAWLNSHSQTSTEKNLRLNSEHSKVIELGDDIPLSESCSLNTVDHNAEPNINSALTKQFKQALLAPSRFYQELEATLALRFIPQKNWFALSQAKQQKFSDHLFTITADSNRMGYRLSNAPDQIFNRLAITPQLSLPVTFGTIQLPQNDQPIVLMKERQTIGGYPVLGTVIQTDLFKLSQLRPGNKVKFLPCNLQFSQQQLSALYRSFSL